MVSDHELPKLLLPEFLIEHLDILKAEIHHVELHIYFEEKNSIPDASREGFWNPKVFYLKLL